MYSLIPDLIIYKSPYLISAGKQLSQDSVILFVPVTFVYNTI